MNYKIGLEQLKTLDYEINNVYFFDIQKQWCFTNTELETYRMYKNTQSVDLRDVVKWQRMENRFNNRYNSNTIKIILEYES